MSEADRIAIQSLRVQTRVGVTEEERSTEQPLVIDLEIETDLAAAGNSDDLGSTVDYHRVTTEVADLVRTTEVKLLETLAEKVAAHLCAFEGVKRVTVAISKESPPIDEDVGPITVRITRP